MTNWVSGWTKQCTKQLHIQLKADPLTGFPSSIPTFWVAKKESSMCGIPAAPHFGEIMMCGNFVRLGNWGRALVVNGWWSSRFLSFLSSTDWRLAHWPSRKHKPCLMAWCTALGWRNPSSSQIHQAADGYMEEWKNSPSWLHWRGRSVFFFKDQQPKSNMVVFCSYICITLDQEGGQILLCRFFLLLWTFDIPFSIGGHIVQ